MARRMAHPNERDLNERGTNIPFLGHRVGVTDVDRQVAVMQSNFRGIGSANPDYLEWMNTGLIKLPEFAEEFGVIPNWQKHPKLFGDTYDEACRRLVACLKQSYQGRFLAFCEDYLRPEYLRQCARSVDFFDRFIQSQEDPDLIIVPLQKGVRFLGFSTKDSREVVARTSKEFGLGVFAVGALVLAHPDLFVCHTGHCMGCTGDEVSVIAGSGIYRSVMYFGSIGDCVEFETQDVEDAYERFGSATAFLL